ncbi:MAG: hypothetical protein AAF661_16600 [Pseudomonadota bacterium]
MFKKGMNSWGWTKRLAIATFLAIGLTSGPAAAACQNASYCAQPGACLKTSQVRAQAQAAYGSQGYSVSRVRLVGNAPTSTCLWFQVRLSHPKKSGRVVYWNLKGGEAR